MKLKIVSAKLSKRVGYDWIEGQVLSAKGKTVGPVAHDETPSKSVVDAAVIGRLA